MAEKSDVVITMLPDSPDVEAVVLGRGGVIEGVHSGQLVIDMSTIAPETSRQVYEALRLKGVDALDAPVSGGDVGAKAGTLSIMVGGDDKAYKRARQIFEALGSNIVYIGGPGAGQIAKACNQIIVALTIQAVAEAMTLARNSGVDPARVRAALLGGFAQSRILDLHGQRIINRDFKPGFKVHLHHKDLMIALQTGQTYSLPLPGTAQVAEMMEVLQAQGKGELDHSALVLVEEQMGGMEIKE